MADEASTMLIAFKNQILCTRSLGKMSPAEIDFLNTVAGITAKSTPGGDGDATRKGPAT